MRRVHGSDISFDKITERLLDRAEYEIERYCLAIGVRFSDLAAAYAGAATQRFGQVLHSPQQRSMRDHVQSVRVEAVEIHQMELPALESSRHSQDVGVALEASGEVQGDRGEEVKPKKPSAIKKYWSKFTPEERKKEMKRRSRLAAKRGRVMVGFGVNPKTLKADKQSIEQKREKDRIRQQKKRDALKAQKKVEKRGYVRMSERPEKTVIKANGRPLLSKEERAAKQKIYGARNRAKVAGLPMPALPPMYPTSHGSVGEVVGG